MSFEDAAVYSCLRSIPPTIVISIDDRGFPITPIDIGNDAVIGVLKLWFNDTEDPELGMSPHDAQRVVAFVRAHADAAPDILVHCAAGISRSAGVAAALERWLNGDDSRILESPHRRPNFLCYERVLDAAGVEHDPTADRERFDFQRKLAEDYEQNLWDYDLGARSEDGGENDAAEPPITQDELDQMEGQWDNIMARIAGDGSLHHPTRLGQYIAKGLSSPIDSDGEEEDRWVY